MDTINKGKYVDVFVRANDPKLDELRTTYDALLTGLRRVEAAIDFADTAYENRVSGGKRPAALKDQALYLERERIYEGARLLLCQAAKELQPLIDPLRREYLRLRPWNQEWQWQIFAVNLTCAMRLLNLAEEQIHNYVHYQILSATDEILKGSTPDAREWTLLESSHGFAFRFTGGDGKKVPDGPYLTRSEAEARAKQDEHTGDTAGVKVRIYNVRTGEWHPTPY